MSKKRTPHPLYNFATSFKQFAATLDKYRSIIHEHCIILDSPTLVDIDKYIRDCGIIARRLDVQVNQKQLTDEEIRKIDKDAGVINESTGYYCEDKYPYMETYNTIFAALKTLEKEIGHLIKEESVNGENEKDDENSV
jgi:hypothetical protein